MRGGGGLALSQSLLSAFLIPATRLSVGAPNQPKTISCALGAVVLGIVLRYGFDMLVGQLITGTGLLLAISAAVVTYQRRRAAIEEGATV